MSGISLRIRNRSTMACEPAFSLPWIEADDTDRRTVRLAHDLMHEQDRIAAVCMRRELRAKLVEST